MITKPPNLYSKARILPGLLMLTYIFLILVLCFLIDR